MPKTNIWLWLLTPKNITNGQSTYSCSKSHQNQSCRKISQNLIGFSPPHKNKCCNLPSISYVCLTNIIRSIFFRPFRNFNTLVTSEYLCLFCPEMGMRRSFICHAILSYPLEMLANEPKIWGGLMPAFPRFSIIKMSPTIIPLCEGKSEQ